MGDKEKYDAYLDLLSPTVKDSVIKEDEFRLFEEKADEVSTHLEKKRQHLEIYEQESPAELDELNNKILELQESYLGKKDLIEDNVKSISALATDIDDLSSTLEKSQSQWNKVEKDYVGQSVGASVIPNFLRSVFNYYPPDHPLYSPGVSSIRGLESEEKPSKFRSFMDKTRLGIETKSKEQNLLSIENMFKKQDLLNTGKNIKQLRDEYYRGAFAMPKGLLEEFEIEKVK